jgi:hypothetical protein
MAANTAMCRLLLRHREDFAGHSALAARSRAHRGRGCPSLGPARRRKRYLKAHRALWAHTFPPGG